MTALVLVSHSPQLAAGIAELVQQMAPACQLALAAGIDDPQHPIGTDAVKIMTAVESVADADGVVILVDLGSAILSAQTALDLLDSELASRTTIAAAPLVEGSLSAATAAAGGADRVQVVAEACAALRAKQAALAETADEDNPEEETRQPAATSRSVAVTVANPHGLHARPAAKLVATLRDFSAELLLEKDGRYADAHSLNAIAALQVRCGERVRLHADGHDAAAALTAFTELAAQHFGECPGNPPVDTAARRIAPPTRLYGCVQQIDMPALPAIPSTCGAEDLERAAAHCRTILTERENTSRQLLGDTLAEIFAAHRLLLDDLCAEAHANLSHDTLAAAWPAACADAAATFAAIDDPYLRARAADIRDLQAEIQYVLADQPRPALTTTGEIILLTGELLPSQALQLGEQVRAVCVTEGSTVSHAAQCCQARGLYYIVGHPPKEVDTNTRQTLILADAG